METVFLCHELKNWMVIFNIWIITYIALRIKKCYYYNSKKISRIVGGVGMKKILVLISISIMLVLSCGNEGKKNENTWKE